MKSPALLSLAGCAVFLARCAAPAAPGDLDVTFYGSGYTSSSFPSAGAAPGGLVIQNDGKLIIGGTVYNDGNAANRIRFCLTRLQPNGQPDNSFGFSAFVNGYPTYYAGRITTPVGLGDSHAYGVALQSDGKIVLAGSAANESGEDFAVVRYLPTVALDPAFGSGGIVITPIGTATDIGRSVTVQTDGKIVVAGSARIGTSDDIALVRYAPDGSLDSTFGIGGKMTTSLTTGNDRAMSMALQSDGKIVVAGAAASDVAVVRYLPDGSLDPSFGTGGKVITDLGSAYDVGYAVAIQQDGNIVVAGSFGPYPGHQFTVLRYQANGIPDLAFGSGGRVTTPIAGSTDAFANSVALQSDGKILVAGYRERSSYHSGITVWEQDMVLVRYAANGSPDASFHGNGMVVTPVVDYYQYDGTKAAAVAVQGDGKIVVCGNSHDVEVVVARFVGGPFTPYDQWKINQINNVNATEQADTDGDGIALLAEYALNLSPTAPSLPPAVARFVYAEGERLRMFFTRDPARNDVTLAVQAADSPAGPWTTVAASTLGGVTTGPGYVGGDDATPGLKTVEVRDTADISPATASRYLRVKVTH